MVLTQTKPQTEFLDEYNQYIKEKLDEAEVAAREPGNWMTLEELFEEWDGWGK
ncbi:MAG: hypothetical protein LBE35_04705 [Clostridiales bacterium]|jgi:hypothetical protein|nr:hypothetical protein [Clostridiales bacterium]